MDAAPQLSGGRLPRLPQQLPRSLLFAACAAVLVLGVAVTGLLILAIQNPASPLGAWLAQLLLASKLLPFVIIALLGLTVYVYWRERTVIANSLLGLMLFQAVLAIGMMLTMLLWVVNTNVVSRFDEAVDDSVAISDSLGDSLLAQARRELAGIGGLAVAAAQDAAVADEGRLLDGLRSRHSLELVAIFDAGGRLERVAPVAAVIGDLTPIVMQRVHQGLAAPPLLGDEAEDALHLVQVERIEPRELGQAERYLWLEARLPAATGADILALEQVSQAYKAARSLRAGVEQAIYIVCYNIVSMLLLLAIGMSIYTGSQLGRRLGVLSDSMRKIAAMDFPQGGAPVTKNDEVTAVARSFNDMVARVSDLLKREQNTRQEIEAIQDKLDAGVLVVDGAGRVQRSNVVAASLLGIPSLEQAGTLKSLERDYPELAELCQLVSDSASEHNKEIKIGERKLWLRIIPRAAGSTTRIVMLTDLSDALAYEELRTRQEAFGYTLHGLKNPLQPLMYHADALGKLAQKLPPGEVGEELTRRSAAITHNIDRINDQIDSMRPMAEETKRMYRPLDLNASVERFLKHRQDTPLEVVTELGAQLPLIHYVENELEDALENLYRNANEQFEVNEIEPRELIIKTRKSEGMVELVFEDNAGGVPERYQSEIFKPHMSRKIKGQGLGLARVHKEIQAAGGSIEVDNIQSARGPGARFTVRFRMAA